MRDGGAFELNLRPDPQRHDPNSTVPTLSNAIAQGLRHAVRSQIVKKGSQLTKDEGELASKRRANSMEAPALANVLQKLSLSQA